MVALEEVRNVRAVVSCVFAEGPGRKNWMKVLMWVKHRFTEN